MGVWRCDDLEEEMHFLCTATGVLCFVFCVWERGGNMYGDREREGEGEEGGREFRGMMGGSMSGKGK